MSTRWKPSVTVAAIIERHVGDTRQFLLVEEHTPEGLKLNNPAGHLDPDESLIDAAIRETLEETGSDVELTGVIGIYLYTAPSNGVTYQRICFAGKAVKHHPDYKLDTGIIGPLWLTRDELLAQRDRWRSELTLQCIDDYLGGKLFDLTLIRPSV